MPEEATYTRIRPGTALAWVIPRSLSTRYRMIMDNMPGNMLRISMKRISGWRILKRKRLRV